MSRVGARLGGWVSAATLLAASAAAHVPTGPTARVSVRDGHLTVEIEVALDRLAAARSGLGEVEVRVDGRPIALVADAPRSPTHAGFARLGLASPEAVPAGADVSLRLPGSLGAVPVTFVEPRTRLTAPGEVARFERRPAPGRPLAALLSGGLAVVALGLVLWVVARGRRQAAGAQGRGGHG